ncbi:hypothetical protein [Streptomyces mashuensis]|uniref:hypothetical protein n=1 Tax=Streptomyces mashuensis TaxID=33904 RepID=UPI00167C7AE6|nr:hypothetical protein [Streptomyces mashuensis]
MKTAWTSAGESVGNLGTDTRKALGALERDHKALGSGGDKGVQSADAEREVHDSWKTYLEAVSGRCDALKEQLQAAATIQHGNDQGAAAAFDKLGQRYKDTPAVGGQKAGR